MRLESSALARALLLASLLLAACAPPTTMPEQETAPAAPPMSIGPPNGTGEPAPAPPASVSAAPSAREQDRLTGFEQRGRVSLYGKDFAGKQTASGDVFDPQRLTMAHPTLPFGTRVRVTNLENHKSVDVVVNDRGPYVPGRIADLSAAAARRIGMVSDGVVQALLQVLGPAKPR
jgi:rare lipoprotein A